MTLDTTSESKPSSASEAPTPVAPVSKKDNKLEINKYFEALVKLDGSDLHLKVDQPPYMRVKGSLQPLKAPPISQEKMKELCLPMLDDRQLKILDDEGGGRLCVHSNCRRYKMAVSSKFAVPARITRYGCSESQ